ncbi:MAG: galactokinase, partial [Saprospiraceae bacterium]|nr:galactokinase [Saprospiraceae bacterium]
PAAIDKYMVAAVAGSDSNMCTVLAIDKKEEFKFSPDHLKPESTNSWRNYVLGVVAEIQKTGKSVPPFNLVFGGDIPEGAGLSSSAALENSIVFALNELFDLKLSKHEMMIISQKAEHNFAAVQCGIMDQYASMFGQEDHALFLDCQTLESQPIKIDLEPYQLVLINSNVKHNLAENAYNERRSLCEKASKLLGIPALRDASLEDIEKLKVTLTQDDYLKIQFVVQENLRVLKAVKLLNKNYIAEFGQLLFEAHAGLRDHYKVSCEEIDFLVDLALKDPAVVGARMMGGGFGGCTINLVEKHKVDHFVEETKNAYHTKFNRSCSDYQVMLTNGTQLIE